MKEKMAVAVVVKPHGIHGQIKLKALTDDPESLLDVQSVYTSESSKDSVVVKKSWLYKDQVCMELEGLTTRNDAEAMRGKKLFIEKKQLPSLSEGSYYIKDLIDCKVSDDDGKPLGILNQVLQYGAADVYVVSGERSFMMPVLKKVIMSVDIEKKEIILNKKALDEVIVYED